MKYVFVTTLIIAVLCAAVGVGITSLSGDRGASVRVAEAQAQAEAERTAQERARQAVAEAQARAEIAQTVAGSAEKLALINALADENRLNGDALRLIATEDVRRRDALRSAAMLLAGIAVLGASFGAVYVRQKMIAQG